MEQPLESLQSTLDHLERLRARAATIKAARVSAEEALCHRLAVAWRCGDLTVHELVTLYDTYRQLGTAGFTHRWNAEDLPHPKRLQEQIRNTPNGPNGTWHGPAALGRDDAAPTAGTPVVYVLYDDHLEPVYVGSTSNLRARLRAHRRDKQFGSWTAQGCLDREHAYAMEAAAIRAHQPALNRVRPTVGAAPPR